MKRITITILMAFITGFAGYGADYSGGLNCRANPPSKDILNLGGHLSVSLVPDPLTSSVAVIAGPHGKSQGEFVLGGEVAHIVIRRKRSKQSDFIQPMSIETEEVTHTNAFGATFSHKRAIAHFNYEETLALASRGDLEVMVFTKFGERRCSLNAEKVVQVFKRRDR